MTEENKNTGLKAFKIAVIVLVVVVSIQLAGRFMLTTDLVHNFVKGKITSVAGEQLNGSLFIGDLEGDLWKEILLTDVSIVQDDEVISMDSLYARYEIWSFLREVYVIDQVRVSGVSANIAEQEDTVFNIQRLIKETDESESEADAANPVQFMIRDVLLREVNADIYAPSYLPDSSLSVKALDAQATFTKADTLYATLDKLNFYIQEGRLPDPVRVGLEGGYADNKVSLEQLVIETGRSLLQGRATAQLADSTFSAEAGLDPFSLKDIRPFIDAEIPDDELSINLSASGSFTDLNITINLNAEFAPAMEVVAGIKLDTRPALTQLEISGEGLDIAHITRDSIQAETGGFTADMSGVLSQDMSRSSADWKFTFNDVRYEEYAFAQIRGSGTLENDNLTSRLDIESLTKDQITLNSTINGLSRELPEWSAGMFIKNLDLQHWLPASELASDLFLSIYVQGAGFELSDDTWEFRIGTIRDMASLRKQMSGMNESVDIRVPGQSWISGRVLNILNGQEIGSFEISGSVNKNQITSTAYVELDSSRVDGEFTLYDFLSEVPAYDYALQTDGFNVAEINRYNDFPTHLSMEMFGEGSRFDPQECAISSTIRIDSSIVNGARIQSLRGQADFEDGILTINEGSLESDIIEGSFTGRKNILNQSDPENWLAVDMTVKNIQPLAPLANVNRLNATGMLKGRVSQDTTEVLNGDLELDLNDIYVDTLFTAARISGETSLSFDEKRNFDVNLDIESPVITGLTFQDIQLQSKGFATDDSVRSDFTVEIIGSDRGRLIQKGTLISSLPENLTDVQFQTFDLVTNESRLALQKPFRVRVQNVSFGTDTMFLKAQDDTYLKFAIPYADSVEQQAWLDGKDFDFGLMQEVIFGERYVDGILSGTLALDRNREDVSGSGAFTLSRITYQEVQVDSLDLDFNLNERRLSAAGSVFWEGDEHISGHVDVPFALFEEELDSAFFRQNIQGELTVRPTDLNRFKPMLSSYGFTETTGILTFNGSMSGTAGTPSFSGDMMLDKPVISGIRLDTVEAGFMYDDVQGGVMVSAEVSAADQKAANIEAKIPISYDFRNYSLLLPGDTDTISVLVETNNFNLAVFNDFLDERYTRGLEGTLNADLVLEGTKENMVPQGYFAVTGGRVNVPIAGITLDKIRTDVDFTEQGLQIRSLSMNSGRGDFRANGNVSLEGIFPDEVNVNLRASQFRLANTADYNLVVDLNSELTGDALTPNASGRFTVRSGFVYLDDFGEKTVEEVYLEGEEQSSFSPYDSLSLDMIVEIQRDFYVRSRDYLDLEIEMVGTLDAQKETKGELSIFGSLDGREGYVRPLGKVFTMEESSFTFSGPVDDPSIYVKSQHIPRTRQKGEAVVLFYIIEGTAQDPSFRFDSEPQMEEQDIVCYTLFGKPCYSLESWQSVFADGEGISATDVLTDVLLEEVEALATRELGVDVVQIDNTGTAGGTSIKTGWYINDRTFFAIVNEITKSRPKTMFILEYIISEKVDLILTQGDSNQRGVDLRFQHDY